MKRPNRFPTQYGALSVAMAPNMVIPCHGIAPGVRQARLVEITSRLEAEQHDLISV
jgi:hypothetical protein